MNIQALLGPLESDSFNDEDGYSAELAEQAGKRFEQEMIDHYNQMAEYFPEIIIDACVVESLKRDDDTVVLGYSRLRPRRSYYEQLGLTLPHAEDPGGPDATGLELRVLLIKGFVALDSIRHPVVAVEFSVWGEHERKAFYNMFRDHRRLLELMLKKPLEFFTSRVFDNLEKYKGEKLVRRLDLYYNNDDDESMFAFHTLFSSLASSADVVPLWCRLLILYYSALGYAQKKKDKDRLLKYYGRFPGWRFDGIAEELID